MTCRFIRCGQKAVVKVVGTDTILCAYHERIAQYRARKKFKTEEKKDVRPKRSRKTGKKEIPC